MLKDLDLHMEAVHGNQASGGRHVAPPQDLSDPELQKTLDVSEGEEGSGMEGGTPFAGSTGATEALRMLSCTVCEAPFRGAAAGQRLNEHLDQHFVGEGVAAMDVDHGQISSEQEREGDGMGADGTPVTEAGDGGLKEIVNVGDDVLVPLDLKKSMKVECPICRLAVHSERDLSRHIDVVH